MSAPPPAADALHAASDDGNARSLAEQYVRERVLARPLHGARWRGLHLRVVLGAALLGCVVVFLLVRALAAAPALSGVIQVSDSGTLQLAGTVDMRQGVLGLIDRSGHSVALDGLLLQRSMRWLTTDADRQSHAAQQDALGQALAGGGLQLILDDGRSPAFDARPRGSGGLGALFWLAAAFAMLLYTVTVAVVVARPEAANSLYAVMALSQAGNLLLLGAESVPTLGMPAGFTRLDGDLRVMFDLATAGALVHVTGIHPRRLSGIRTRAVLVWIALAGLAAAVTTQRLTNAWWWTQAAMIGCGLLAVAQLAWSQRAQPHPLAAAFWRFCLLTVITLVLLTAALAAIDLRAAGSAQLAAIGPAAWLIFIASMLLMLPFLARTQQLMRELSLLAGVSAVAASLDLMFVAVFAPGSFASLTLALFIALGAYIALRQWLLDQMLARERSTAERMFERLYRVAREVQVRPQSVGDQLASLLRDAFEPLEIRTVERHMDRARVVGNGASLLVPIPRLGGSIESGVIELHFAQRGRRMFSANDARMADRMVEQLGRAVAFDAAVERGRSEERLRIAQDLHDDIGARLLTLIYQAPTREMEDYLRHTLKDLKTLTRGLAATDHRLSHAVVEWKADIAQRLAAADCDLGWAFAYDSDIELSVVQWSAVTRILRELVSNAIAHARATRIDIDAGLEQGVLNLSVTDNGIGRDPDIWPHGLGLGGVRKRVRQLGGEVRWREAGRRGIACHVVIRGLGNHPA
jgi:signal transduction histidine kinase